MHYAFYRIYSIELPGNKCQAMTGTRGLAGTQRDDSWLYQDRNSQGQRVDKGIVYTRFPLMYISFTRQTTAALPCLATNDEGR
jgi:hypothetical protein